MKGVCVCVCVVWCKAELLEQRKRKRKRLENKSICKKSEVLGDSGIALSRVDAGVFNASVAARLHIPNDGLIVVATVSAVGVHVTVVWVLAIVTSRRVGGRHMTLL